MKPGVRPPAALLNAHAAPLLLSEDGVLAGFDVGSHIPREDDIAVLKVIVHEALRVLWLGRSKSHRTKVMMILR